MNEFYQKITKIKYIFHNRYEYELKTVKRRFA